MDGRLCRRTAPVEVSQLLAKMTIATLVQTLEIWEQSTTHVGTKIVTHGVKIVARLQIVRQSS